MHVMQMHVMLLQLLDCSPKFVKLFVDILQVANLKFYTLLYYEFPIGILWALN
jgi:hypothetical protein